jgi:hypothetical protein
MEWVKLYTTCHGGTRRETLGQLAPIPALGGVTVIC